MLTAKEIQQTSQELTENYRRLGYSRAQVACDLQIRESEIERILTVKGATPNHVWMMRDYLEDMLKKEGKELFPYSRLANHAVNRWFDYDTPWRSK